MNQPRPRTGDVVVTQTNPTEAGFKGWFVVNGIRFYQRTLRGYPPPSWKKTHCYWVYDNDGRMLSVTDPVVKWEFYDDEEVQKKRPLILRPTFAKFTMGDIKAGREAACKMIGLRYDRGQLLDILLNEVMGFAPGDFHRIFDAGQLLTVCSGGVGAVYEAMRRAHENHYGEAWPRLFDGLYIERYPPAIFLARPRGKTWPRPFRLITPQLEVA